MPPVPPNPGLPLAGTPDIIEQEMEIPDSVVTSVLSQFGYAEASDVEPVEPAPEVAEVVETPAPEAPGDVTPEVEAGVVEPAEDEPLPVPPGGPIFDDAASSDPAAPATAEPSPPALGSAVTLPNGQVVSPYELQQWAALNARIQTDPSLRDGLSRLLNPQAAPVPTPVAQQSNLPPLPQLTPDDLEDPAIRGLVMVAGRMQQEIAELRQSHAQTQSQVVQRQYQDAREVTLGAASQFQRTYNLPEEIMTEVRDIASRSNAMNLYMAGVDPQSGRPVQPDPYKAVESALSMAYWNSPRARVFEIERQSAHRAKTSARKTKLGGIGGSSGSAHRQPQLFDTSTEQGRHQAQVAEVAAAMGIDE